MSIETGGSIKNPPRNQIKYQYIKLMKSGRSLTETKALFRSVSAALDKEYTSTKDIADLLALEGGIHRMSMTRGGMVNVMKIKFAPRKLRQGRTEEILAKWLTSWRGRLPHDWKRDGNLIRRGKPNKPKPNSSRGKIGRTKVIGAARVLRDFKRFIATMQRLVKSGKKGDIKGLQKAYKSVRINITPKY